MNNLKFKEYYKRKLPHFQPENGIFAITFRLAFTLPEQIISELKERKAHFDETADKMSEKELKIFKKDFDKSYFEHFDDFIDKYNDNCNWLSIPEIADIVSKAIFFYNEKKYRLYCYCIMPNHVHLILEPFRKDENGFFSLSELLFSIKSYTANKCNEFLKREGKFWHHENYDHVIRNENDLFYQTEYIVKNPVSAGLVKNWKEWKYTYCLDLQSR